MFALVVSVVTLWLLPMLDFLFVPSSCRSVKAVRLVHYVEPDLPKVYAVEEVEHKPQKSSGFARQFPKMIKQIHSTPLEVSNQFDFSGIKQGDRPDLHFAIKDVGDSFADFELGGLGFKLSQVDVLPVALNKLRPNYPYQARRRGVEGEVLLSFVITESGTVSHLRVLRSSPEGVFDESARQAVKSWKFRPARKGGEAVPVLREQLIRFGLDK
jgi:TonB family protein